jgi:hypothetical protein
MSRGAPLDRSWRFGPGVIFEEGVGFGVGKRVTAQGGVRATSQQLTTDPARQPHGRPRGSRAHADAPHAHPRQLGDVEDRPFTRYPTPRWRSSWSL